MTHPSMQRVSESLIFAPLLTLARVMCLQNAHDQQTACPETTPRPPELRLSQQAWPRPLPLQTRLRYPLRSRPRRSRPVRLGFIWY